MDVGTIGTALLALGVLSLFMVLVRGMPRAEDDVAAVVAAILGTPVEIEGSPADVEEPARWRIDLLTPPGANGWKAADRSKRYGVAKPLAGATR